MRHVTTTKKVGPHKTAKDLAFLIVSAQPGKYIKECRSNVILGNGKSLLENQVETIRSVLPNADIIVATGFDAEKVYHDHKHLKIRFVEIERFNEDNIVRNIYLAHKTFISSSLVLVHGDIWFNKEAISGLVDTNSSLLVVPSNQCGKDKTGVIIDEKIITNLDYSLPEKWGQIANLTGNELDKFQALISEKHNWRKFTFELMNEIIDANGKFQAYQNPKAKVVEIETLKDIDRC